MSIRSDRKKTYTLDTNCIIDVDERRQDYLDVFKLVEAYNDNKIDLALVAAAASEKQKDGSYLESFRVFTERLKQLNFPDIPALPAITYWDISFWDKSILANEQMKETEKLIFETLFPKIAYNWVSYANENGVDPKELKSSSLGKKWRNRLCDVQAFWAHTHAQRDVFVTSDAVFRRLQKVPAFANVVIATPSEAVALL